MSVPDSELLVSLSEALETPVSTLLGETVTQPQADDLKAISEKLEIINLQLAKRQADRRMAAHLLFIILCALTATVAAALIALNSPYLGWDLADPETAVFSAAFHVFEWIFVRIAPLLLIGSVAGIILTRRRA